MLLCLGAQIADVHVPFVVAGDDDDAHAGHDRAGRIGAVRRGRNEDDVAPAVPARLMPGPDHQQTGQLALRSGVRLQRHAWQPGDLAQGLLEPFEHFAIARRLLRRRRTDACARTPAT